MQEYQTSDNKHGHIFNDSLRCNAIAFQTLHTLLYFRWLIRFLGSCFHFFEYSKFIFQNNCYALHTMCIIQERIKFVLLLSWIGAKKMDRN